MWRIYSKLPGWANCLGYTCLWFCLFWQGWGREEEEEKKQISNTIIKKSVENMELKVVNINKTMALFKQNIIC